MKVKASVSFSIHRLKAVSDSAAVTSRGSLFHHHGARTIYEAEMYEKMIWCNDICTITAIQCSQHVVGRFSFKGDPEEINNA